MAPNRYEDRRVSGGTMERTALKRLRGGVERGLIDVLLVCKIHRLARVLMDFAKLLAMFDANDVTLGSVTQSVNTTTRIGGLTPNIPFSLV